MIDLNELSKEAYIIAKKRENNGAFIHTEPMAILKHCATEVVEATEAFCDYREALNEALNNDNLEMLKNEWIEKFENEIADIIVCCLIVSGYSMIDIEKALNRVMEKNRLRAEKMGDKL